jgi:putative polyketide hydroxylase
LWVSKDDERLSTLDLFQRDWVLLADDDRWVPAAAQAGASLGIELECLRIGVDFHPSDRDAFRAAFGLNAAGASLVRPDGYVAWRSIDLPTDVSAMLTEALGRVSSAAESEKKVT